MKRPDVTTEEIIIKRYYVKELYDRELYFYQHSLIWYDFHPKLLAYNDSSMTLYIEKCTPILNIRNNKKYKQPLWDLLQRLHDNGFNHRDISLKNVVVKDGKVLLIDWENAEPWRRLDRPSTIGKVSADLYGAKEAGVEPQNPDVWWGGPWDHCPGKYWK